MSKQPNAGILHDAASVGAAINRLTDQISPEAAAAKSVAIVGIRTRGLTLATRLLPMLKERLQREIHFGILDITLYRDDLSTLGSQPMVGTTDIGFDLDGCTVFLVDDVLYSGRTSRAALEALLAFGRPAAVRLVTLVDRGHREYPIQPDYTGYRIETKRDQIVHVKLEEVDGSEGIHLVTR